jgi:hypothetical protein
MKSNIETYLRLKPILNENENDNKNIKSKMINYQIDPNQKNKISIYIPDDLRQGYINNMKKSYEFKTVLYFATVKQVLEKHIQCVEMITQKKKE